MWLVPLLALWVSWEQTSCFTPFPSPHCTLVLLHMTCKRHLSHLESLRLQSGVSRPGVSDDTFFLPLGMDCGVVQLRGLTLNEGVLVYT